MVLQIALATIQGTVDRFNVEYPDIDWHQLVVSYNPTNEEYEAYIEGVTHRVGGLKTVTTQKGTGESFELAIISLAAELSVL